MCLHFLINERTEGIYFVKKILQALKLVNYAAIKF